MERRCRTDGDVAGSVGSIGSWEVADVEADCLTQQ